MDVTNTVEPGMPGSASDIVRPGRSPRPVPSDFGAMAAMHTRRDLRRHYRIGAQTVGRWLEEIGLKAKRPPCVFRPMPEDFPARAHERNAVLLEAYQCSDTLIARWRRQCGVAPEAKKPSLPLPADFADVARSLSIQQLKDRYGVSKGVVNRWRKQVGGAVAAPRPRVRFLVAPLPILPPAARDMSIAGRAADHLRSPRGGGWIVYRCTAAGQANRDGDHFFVGTRVMTEDDMLQMAERKGFRAFEDMPRLAPAITSTAVSL